MFAGRAEFCFGLHATLSAEWDAVKWGPILPAEQVPSLVDECGLFFTGPHIFRERPPRMHEILAELQAQLDKVRRLGFPVAYVRFAHDDRMGRGWPGRADVRVDGTGGVALSRLL